MFQSSNKVKSNTAFYFGKTGAGEIAKAVMDATAQAGKQPVMVIAFGPLDGLVGDDPITGQKLPEVQYAQVTEFEQFTALDNYLNQLRAEGKLPGALIVYGLSQMTNLIAAEVAGGGQPSQAQFGTIGRKVLNKLHYWSGFSDVFYVTCDLVVDDDNGELRFNVQPAVSKNVAAMLHNAYYVYARSTGREVQGDKLLALAFRPMKSKATKKTKFEEPEEEEAEEQI